MEGGRGASVWDTFTHKYPGNSLHTISRYQRMGMEQNS